MKVYLKGEAQKYPELVGLLTEDKLINNKKELDQILSSKNLEVEKIEINGDQKIIYIKENEKTKKSTTGVKNERKSNGSKFRLN